MTIAGVWGWYYPQSGSTNQRRARMRSAVSPVRIHAAVARDDRCVFIIGIDLGRFNYLQCSTELDCNESLLFYSHS